MQYLWRQHIVDTDSLCITSGGVLLEIEPEVVRLFVFLCEQAEPVQRSRIVRYYQETGMPVIERRVTAYLQQLRAALGEDGSAVVAGHRGYCLAGTVYPIAYTSPWILAVLREMTADQVETQAPQDEPLPDEQTAPFPLSERVLFARAAQLYQGGNTDVAAACMSIVDSNLKWLLGIDNQALLRFVHGWRVAWVDTPASVFLRSMREAEERMRADIARNRTRFLA